MSPDEVVDLRELARRAPRTDAEQDRLAFCARVVEAATARWYRGLASPTPLPCGLCPDRIVVLLSDDGEEAHWRCESCGRGGIVRDWRGTAWDHTLVELPGASDLAAWMEVEVTLAQYDVLVGLEELTHAPRKVVHGAQWVEGGALLHAPAEAFVMLRDVVAAAAVVARTRGDEELLREVHATLDAALDAG